MNRANMIRMAVAAGLIILIAGGSLAAWRHVRKERAGRFFNEALEASRAGRADRAMSLLYSAVELDPCFSQAYSLLGWQLFQKENWDRSERLLLKAVRCDPRSNQDWFLLAELYYRRGNLRAFITSLATALKIDPQYPKPYLQRALMHYDLHLYELALSDVDRLLALEPDNAAGRELRDLIIGEVKGKDKGDGGQKQKEMKYFRIAE